MYYAFIQENSRKAKAARQLYEQLKKNNKQGLIPEQNIGEYTLHEGVPVAQQDKQKVLNLRLHDEHLSPYFKTDMNLFILLMIDDKVDIQIFKADSGWMLLFDNVQNLPKPFGTQGYDMR